MGNSKSHAGQEFCSQFLPEEQAEINRLFDALSSEQHGSNTSPGSFSLEALKARGTAVRVQSGVCRGLPTVALRPKLALRFCKAYVWEQDL